MTFSRDYYDWQNRVVFDPARDGYSGQINSRVNGPNNLSADIFNSAMYTFSWFGASANIATITGNSTWQPFAGPGNADAVATFYPVGWRDKVRQLNGGVLTNINFGLFAPFSGWYKCKVDLAINTTPTSGGAINFFSAGCFYGASPSGQGRIYSANLVGGSASGFAYLAANTLVRPAAFIGSVGSNGVFRATDIFIELTLVSMES